MCVSIMRNNISEAWDELLALLIATKSQVNPRGYATRELLGVQLNLTDMRNNILVNTARDLNYRFMVAEWLWIAMGRNDVASLARYNNQMRNFSDDGYVLNGAYGPPIVAQLPYVLTKLREDPNSRQAVINLWKNSPDQSKDIPCTLTMQFLARHGKLHMIVNMRSSDIWLGIPYDVFTFTQVGMGAAAELKLQPGQLTLNLGSSHLYERDVQRADDTRNWKSYTLRSMPLPSWPPIELNGIFDNNAMHWREPWTTYLHVLTQPSKDKALGVLKAWLDPR